MQRLSPWLPWMPSYSTLDHGGRLHKNFIGIVLVLRILHTYVSTVAVCVKPTTNYLLKHQSIINTTVYTF